MRGVCMYNNLINDYIRKVTKDMGSNQRKEVAKELETHILDSAEALAARKNTEIDETIIREVIGRMGSPEGTASMYPAEKTFSDSIIDTLKSIGIFTVIFILVASIVGIVLRILFSNIEFISFLLVTSIVYLVLLAIHLIRRFEIVSKLLKKIKSLV
jgi:hypothetical protein